MPRLATRKRVMCANDRPLEINMKARMRYLVPCVGVSTVVCVSTGDPNRLVTVAPDNSQTDLPSRLPDISATGRFVVFASSADNLVEGDDNEREDVFVRDMLSGSTVRVSAPIGAGQANGHSAYPAISGDGRYVVFESEASNLVQNDTNGGRDIFLVDRTAGTIERVNVATDGSATTIGNSEHPTISGDGRFVAFRSFDPGLVTGDHNGDWDIFVRDLAAGTTERMSVSTSGTEGLGPSNWPALSRGGRYCTFQSLAPNLVGADTNGAGDVFLRDRVENITERVSVGTGGVQGSWNSFFSDVSDDGRYIVFDSQANNFAQDDQNGFGPDIFLHDRQTGVTTTVSATPHGETGDRWSIRPRLTIGAAKIVFESDATDLVPR